MVKRLLGIAMSAAMGAALMAAPAAEAATVKACVKKKTGDVRILTGKKKCKKGWKKVSWNQTGATGPQGQPGAAGSAQMVKDGTGKVLGKYLGIYPAGFTLFFVEIEGGSYLFAPNGQLFPLGSQSPSWKNAACSGTAYMTASSAATLQLLTGSAGGPARIMFRPTTPVIGVARAWALTTVSEDVNQQLYKRDSSNACVVDGAVYNGKVVALQEVAAPQDVPGPLTIG